MKFKYIFYPIIFPIFWVSGVLSLVFINIAWGCASIADYLNNKVLKMEEHGFYG